MHLGWGACRKTGSQVSRSSSLYFLDAGMAGMHYHTWNSGAEDVTQGFLHAGQTFYQL